jgi:hypothetical protein
MRENPRTEPGSFANRAIPMGFPFDVFFHPVRSPELWRNRDGSLDVGGALAKLTRGLDERGYRRFEAGVHEHMAAPGFLPPGFFN